MNFVGLKPLELNVPLIELETSAGEVVDLYNENWLRSAIINADGLTFEFTSSQGDGRGTLVRFAGLRNLRVEQPPDWVPEESSQIDHLLIPGPWPRVVFKAGGLEYEFDCAELSLSTV